MQEKNAVNNLQCWVMQKWLRIGNRYEKVKEKLLKEGAKGKGSTRTGRKGEDRGKMKEKERKARWRILDT